MANKTAMWTISLDVECPHCKEDIDLLDDPEFFIDKQLDLGEHGTPKSRDVEVHCHLCGEEFTVDLEY